MNRVLLSIALTLLPGIAGISTARAQSYRWRQIPNPPSALSLRVDHLAADRSGVLYAGADGDCFRSTDDGRTWKQLDTLVSSHGVNGVAIDPGGGVYLGLYKDGIFRSTDHGASWRKVSNGFPVDEYNGPVGAIGDVIIAQSDDGPLFRSTDAGESWSKVDSFPRMRAERFVAIGGVLLACGRSEIYRSTDRGLTWSNTVQDRRPQAPWVAVTPHGLYYGGTQDNRIYHSVDSGSHWTPLGSRLPASVCTVLGADGSGTLIAGTDSGLFRSTDRGGTWRRVIRPSGSGFFRSFIAAPGDQLFVGTDGRGVLRSTDHGGTWRTTTMEPMPADINDVAIDRRDRIFTAVQGSGLFISGDHGRHWRRCNLGRSYRGADLVEISRRGTILALIDGRKLMRSTDGGGRWRTIYIDRKIGGVRIDRDERIFLTIDDRYVLRSEDGHRWDTITAIPKGDNVEDYINWVAASPWGKLFMRKKDSLYRSDDHGDHWRLLPLPRGTGRSGGIAFLPNRNIFIGTEDGGILRSTDQGKTWLPRPTGYSGWSYTLLYDPRGTLICETDEGRLVGSDDEGRRWRLVSGDFRKIWFNSVGIDSRGRIFGATENAGMVMGRRIPSRNKLGE